MPSPAIAFDLTPLQNAHRHRGIGTYVRGLARRLAAQSEVPLEFWGWHDGSPIRVSPPHTAVWLARPPTPQYRGAWIIAQIAMRLRARKSAVKAVHITDPDALAPLAGRKLMATVYDLIPLHQPMPRRRILANLGYSSYLNAVRHTDTLFAISQQTADDLVHLLQVPTTRVLVARPGVDSPLPSGERARERGAQGSRPYFLYVGGPNPNKNLPLVLDAVAICTDLDEELLIAGQWLPKQVDALNAQLKARGLDGRARHIGFVPDDQLAALMSDATALVLPSLLEGFGLPVAEGLAVGALVVHSDLPVLRETSSGAALTFDHSSASDLASCLRLAARDVEMAARLRKQGLARAKALTWDSAVATTLAAYREVLA